MLDYKGICTTHSKNIQFLIGKKRVGVTDIEIGFLPKNHIRSDAFCQSLATVSPRHTGFIPKDRQNYEFKKTLITT